MRVLLIGHGRMGRLVESLAPEYGYRVTRILDSSNNAGGVGLDLMAPDAADVAIDFYTPAALVENFPRLARLRINVVIGTTGWQQSRSELQRLAADAGIGVVAAPNFSLGVALFTAMVEHAAALFAGRSEYGVWLHESHHAAKRDAPSGTALLLKDVLGNAGCATIDVASTRAGFFPGTHEVGFDSAADTITLTHTARDRSGFARGALQAAAWVRGRRGWFGIRDVLGLAETGAAPAARTSGRDGETEVRR